MSTRRLLSPHFTNSLQLAITILVAAYMILIGGAFNATVSFRVQLLNAVAASIIAIVWLGARLWQRQRLLTTGLELPLAFFVGVQWLTSLTSVQPRLSVEQAATTTAWVLAFIILSDLLARGWPRLFIENALVLIAGFITIEALWETGSWLLSWLKLGMAPLLAYRVVGFLGHPNLTAAALNLILPLVIFRVIRTSGFVSRFTWGLLILGMLIVEFFTSSRSGWVGTASLTITLFGLLFIKKSEQNYLQQGLSQWNRLSRGIRFAILLGVGLLIISFGYVLWRQTLQISHPEFFSSRQFIWGPAWANFLARPLVGIGPGLYSWSYSKYVSTPPDWLAPHAHSILFQTLSDSGLVGLLAGLGLLGSAGYLFWKHWHSKADHLWTAVFISIAVGWFVHHLFDYLFGTPAFVFLFVTIAALAFSPQKDEQPVYQYQPLYLGLPLVSLIALGAFLLRAASLNDQGLTLVSNSQWPEAAVLFEEAAQTDPGLTLYWQNAAYAETRAGNLATAQRLWQQAQKDDPYWALFPATLGLLQSNLSDLQTATRLAPHSDLLALNLGALAEKLGDLQTAQDNYQQALTLKPGLASALFWQQTNLRQKTLRDWEQTLAPLATSLDKGQRALTDQNATQAIQLFNEAQVEFPLSNGPYMGLARAYWLAGDELQAQHYYQIARLIPVITPGDTLALYLFEGDWAEAHGDRAGAINAYKTAFSIVNDYTSDGPGTYGYPQRSWLVYHRPTAPSDLVPQFAHADVTPELDLRFVTLAGWILQTDDKVTACYILKRVYREAPDSQSGQLYGQACPPE